MDTGVKAKLNSYSAHVINLIHLWVRRLKFAKVVKKD